MFVHKIQNTVYTAFFNVALSKFYWYVSLYLLVIFSRANDFKTEGNWEVVKQAFTIVKYAIFEKALIVLMHVLTFSLRISLIC